MESEAKKIIKGDNLQKDLVSAGFHKLDENLIERRPPKISWGMLYKNYNVDEKILYLEKLASTMNHAAYLIQEERNELTSLCELKENQLIKLKGAVDANNAMLQSEITKINEERQSFNQSYAELKQKLDK